MNKNTATMRNQGFIEITFISMDEIESDVPNEMAINAIIDETGIKFS